MGTATQSPSLSAAPLLQFISSTVAYACILQLGVKISPSVLRLADPLWTYVLKGVVCHICVQFCKWSTVSFHASTLLFSKLYINAMSLSVAISNCFFFLLLFLRWQTRESPSAFLQLRLVTWAEASFVASLVKWHIVVNPDCDGNDTGKIVRTASGTA